MLFFRRGDIGVRDRALIACEAIVGDGIYGTVTGIAENYGISRPFVYELKKSVLNFIESHEKNAAELKLADKILADKLILLLRLCCKSSIGGISEVLKLLELPHSSVGYISEFLKEKASGVTVAPPPPDGPVTVLADEIFLGSTPVLVVLEAVSHAILAAELSEDRTGEAWRRCFENLLEKGYVIDKVAKDLGSGMANGIKSFDMISQADLFHLLKKFDPFLGSLEKSAFALIESEERAFKVLMNRKTETAVVKQALKCERVSNETRVAVMNFDNYDFLHKELHAAFDPFNRDGSFRDEETVRGDVEAALDLLEEAFGNRDGIMKAVAFMRKHLTGYMPYVRQMKDVLNAVAGSLPEYLIREVCLHYSKGLKSVAVKNYAKSKSLEKESEEHMRIALLAAGDAEVRRKLESLATDLSGCVRSSSALEAKNSVIRSFFNSSSSQVTQEYLRLICLHQNLKVAIRGKYKGKSPLQRLGGFEENPSIVEALAC